MHLSWNAHGEDHYLWHLADGNEVRVVDGHHGQQEFMEPEEAFIAALASCHLLSFLTEAAREAQMLFGGDVLVAEKDHQVFQERPANFSDDVVTQWLRQIDAANFGAQGRRKRARSDNPVSHLPVSRCDAVYVEA